MSRGNWWKTLNEKEYYDPEDWEECPDCKTKPYIWEFDNGRFAECDCMEDYKINPVTATNIGQLYSIYGNTAKYDTEELLINWNKHIKHLIRKNKIRNLFI